MLGSFTDLKIWQKGFELAKKIYECTGQLPLTEQYGLVQQLRRSANSIIANIAESQGRYSFKDKIRVLYQARGEVFETRSHLKLAEGVGYLSKEVASRIDVEYDGLVRGINTYIRHLSEK